MPQGNSHTIKVQVSYDGFRDFYLENSIKVCFEKLGGIKTSEWGYSSVTSTFLCCEFSFIPQSGFVSLFDGLSKDLGVDFERLILNFD